jgi:urocanate hydratase
MRTVRAPRGPELSCRSWGTEAALRMLMNNLDPEVAERPEDLVVYGGRGRAARSWEAFDALVTELRRLGPDETLLVQSGKPVGVVQTHPDAPRVLMANANLVPHWATQEVFDDLERRGLTMYGQMTAGSWIYIGTQGILQGTWETFAECARQHFGGSLAGRLVVTAGCGGMGGAQPLSVTLNGGVCLVADVDGTRLERRRHDGYLDEVVGGVDPAVDRALGTRPRRRGPERGGRGERRDPARAAPRAGDHPDVLTDQTSAHDPLEGYVPEEWTLEEAARERVRDPAAYVERSTASMERHVRAMVALQERGAVTFDYGNNLRQRAADRVRGGLRLPRLRAGLHPPAVLPGARALPVGGALGRGRRHLRHGPRPPRALSRTMRGSVAGSSGATASPTPSWRATLPPAGPGSDSRGSRRASAGWATASGTGPGCSSTRWWPTGGWRRRW